MARSAVPRELRAMPFRRRDAVAAGLVTPARLLGPHWRRLYHGVYIEADAFAQHDHRMWCEAALLAAPPGSAVGGLSAACLWSVDLLASGDPVTVIVPRPHHLRAQPRLRLIHADLPAPDVERFAGLLVTTPVRTAFDLGRGADRTASVIAVDAMLQRRLVTPGEIAALADRRPGWPGLARLREVLRVADGGAASPMETRLRLLIVDGGLPRPVTQYVARDRDGRLIGRVDLAYPQLGIVLEYEGDHHRDPATFRKDIARFNRLRSAEWIALRFTADDVFKRPRTIVEDVRRAVAEATALRGGAQPSGRSAGLR
ncbi:hypothetical protein J2S43_007775 [Catenuloplanes nepalensis]|uniref:DUF559 domain-containing protein n=1 Tax=Catenuloplanes nepalensis TaxID=587533 RepID=A0ABT9N6V5_9ACTN|nr:hypothetical protein [Catenuloplanes nepalensis]MDP9799263.1 hypothetical protein [Catenuloplanes nepalensis]